METNNIPTSGTQVKIVNVLRDDGERDVVGEAVLFEGDQGVVGLRLR